jgi:murein L,D-transpeptidase YcbB/YkuD
MPSRSIISVPETETPAKTPATNSNAQAAPAEPASPPASPAAEIKSTIEKLFAASDTQITDRLRDMIPNNKLEKRLERAPERKAIEAAYASRGYAPMWIKDGRLTARANAVIARLKSAGVDGLDPVDYPAPDFGAFNSADALAEGDLKLTISVLTFARHMQTGRIAPTRVTVEADHGNHTPEPADILKKLETSDANAAFDSFNPPHAGFKALKAKLAELRANASMPVARLADGPLLRPGMKDARVPELREKLGLAGNPADTTFDGKLSNAVKAVQRRADIQASGNLDAKTVAAINGPKPSQMADTVLANMERWRWLPRDLGRTYVMVNIPDYTLKVVRDHNVVWRTKIVAGKPQTPTPLTSEPMDHVIVNPSWYVPQSIIQNELLPLYETDPNVFNRMGLEVKRGADGNINVVQPPGAANALGHIKFAFPNKFQVYLHDTPEKRLFAHEKRAFSHGCMRVENPTKFGEVILSLAMNGPTPNAQQINAMYGQDERTYKLINRPMVHLTYQTAYVDDGGKLVIRDDLYGFDARYHAILKSDERRVADVAPPADPKRDLATLKSNQEILRRVERREAQNPFIFFERLFR